MSNDNIFYLNKLGQKQQTDDKAKPSKNEHGFVNQSDVFNPEKEERLVEQYLSYIEGQLSCISLIAGIPRNEPSPGYLKRVSVRILRIYNQSEDRNASIVKDLCVNYFINQVKNYIPQFRQFLADSLNNLSLIRSEKIDLGSQVDYEQDESLESVLPPSIEIELIKAVEQTGMIMSGLITNYHLNVNTKPNPVADLIEVQDYQKKIHQKVYDLFNSVQFFVEIAEWLYLSEDLYVHYRDRFALIISSKFVTITDSSFEIPTIEFPKSINLSKQKITSKTARERYWDLRNDVIRILS
ncbi:MAG: hypothetical protein OHK0017_10330 [Patescibacteria group bacterium]